MAVTNGPLSLFLLKADGLVRCRWDGASARVDKLNCALEGETLRELARDPFDPKRLYAATLTEIHVSEDGGETWKWLPSGGLDYRDIWAMAVHPTRPNEIYVGTLPAAIYVSENGGRSFLELSALRNLPEYNKWTFPPPPHTPHVRCIRLDARVLTFTILISLATGIVFGLLPALRASQPDLVADLKDETRTAGRGPPP